MSHGPPIMFGSVTDAMRHFVRVLRNLHFEREDRAAMNSAGMLEKQLPIVPFEFPHRMLDGYSIRIVSDGEDLRSLALFHGDRIIDDPVLIDKSIGLVVDRLAVETLYLDAAESNVVGSWGGA